MSASCLLYTSTSTVDQNYFYGKEEIEPEADDTGNSFDYVLYALYLVEQASDDGN